MIMHGIAADAPEAVGKPYEDGDGNAYLALLGQPVVYAAAWPSAVRATRSTRCSRAWLCTRNGPARVRALYP
ncbi:MAG: DUF2000 family protein [Nocardiopsaceae bacterium]|nr:DUF2000 family protein [Nocardiopsaceae bacterium]